MYSDTHVNNNNVKGVDKSDDKDLFGGKPEQRTFYDGFMIMCELLLYYYTEQMGRRLTMTIALACEKSKRLFVLSFHESQ